MVPTKNMARYIALTVFKNALTCSTNGASKYHHTLYVEDPEGQEMAFPPNPEQVFKVREVVAGHKVLVPEQLYDGVGPMFGGNLASSLYGVWGALTFRIHDRFETPADYDRLTR